MTSLPRLTKIIVSLTLILVIIQIVVANRLSSAGFILNSLKNEEKSLTKENELLERKIATSSSLTHIAKKAEDEGFVKAQTLYLSPKVSVAAGFLNVNAPK